MIRKLVNGLAGPAVAVDLPCSSSLSQARLRLGVAPMRALWQALAGPIANSHTPGAKVAGLWVVSIGGDLIDVEDTTANAYAYGTPATTSGPAGYPQLRLVALSEASANAIVAAEFGPRETGCRGPFTAAVVGGGSAAGCG